MPSRQGFPVYIHACMHAYTAMHPWQKKKLKKINKKTLVSWCPSIQYIHTALAKKKWGKISS